LLQSEILLEGSQYNFSKMMEPFLQLRASYFSGNRMTIVHRAYRLRRKATAVAGLNTHVIELGVIVVASNLFI
jgi:hypothetical protein